MAARNQNVILYTDSDVTLIITVENVTTLDDATNVVWKVARSKTAPPLVVKELGNGISIDGNQLIVTLVPADTADLRSGDYFHEARVTTAQGKTRPVTVGTAKVIETLTSS